MPVPALLALPLGMGALPILLLRLRATVFHFIGGYATVHLIRSNVLFNPNKESDANWLSLVGGPIYDGWFTRRLSGTPTLSEDGAYLLANHLLAMITLFFVLSGAGLMGLSGGATAMLFDGPHGGERYCSCKQRLRGGKQWVYTKLNL